MNDVQPYPGQSWGDFTRYARELIRRERAKGQLGTIWAGSIRDPNMGKYDFWLTPKAPEPPCPPLFMWLGVETAEEARDA